MPKTCLGATVLVRPYSLHQLYKIRTNSHKIGRTMGATKEHTPVL